MIGVTKMEEKKTQKKKASKKNKVKKMLSSQEGIIRVVKAVSVVLIILILLFIAADRFGNITFSSVGDYFSAMVSGAKQGDGYPYKFESVTPKSVKQINSDLLVMTGDSTFVLDSTARKLSALQHTYSAPVINTKNARAIMFDVGGYSYRVQSKTKVLYEGSSTSKILTAAIGKDGTVALATRGEGSSSELIVYNKNQKEVFRWACAKDNIIAADVSDNGKCIAVSVVGAENGELYSRVLMFDFDYSEPIAEFNYGSRIVSRVEFLSGDTLLVSGENIFCFITNKKEQTEIDVSLNTLSGVYTAENNMTVASFSKYGSSSSKIIRAYSRQGKELFTCEIESAVRSVSCSGSYISVLTDTQLLTYSKSGKLIGENDVTGDSVRCYTDGNRTYVLTTSGIDQYDSATSVKESTTAAQNSEFEKTE